jgi:phage gp45-like
VFSGVGFYARPKVGHNAEAVVVFPGGAANPIIIATRDEDARKAMAKLNADETAVFNSTTVILIKKDGTVEVRAANGTAKSLVHFDTFSRHVHSCTAPGNPSGPPIPVVSVPPPGPGDPPTVPLGGTTVLKAQ